MARQTREKILNAADALFGELGFEATSTRLIGERSGTNRGLIHYHFKNKQDLFDQVLDRYYQSLQTALADVLAQPRSPRERLTRIVEVYADFLFENKGFSRILQRVAMGGESLDRIVTRLAPMLEMGVGAIEGAYPKARNGPAAAEDLILSFYGMTVTYFSYQPVLERLTGADGYSPKALARRKRHLRWMVGVVIDALEAGELDGVGSPTN